MVKRRVPKASSAKSPPTPEQVERFAEGAEPRTPLAQARPQSFRSPRNYKAIRVPFSENEFNALTELAQMMGCSKLSAIRHALAEQVKRERRKAKRAANSER